MSPAQRKSLGSLDELKKMGCLTGKVGSQPVCVFWDGTRAFAVDDRCPHMGFPLHRGTVESGLLTCHWHHARFDLESGGTLDPWADDVRAYPVEISNGQVTVVVEPQGERVSYQLGRLEEGLEQGTTLVIAKAVLGLLEAGVASTEIVRSGISFGLRNREAGWGSGLTVLTAMANILGVLATEDRPLALVQGLAFLSRDTRGRPPRFPLSPLPGQLEMETLQGWYRRFIDSRSSDAAERTLATAISNGHSSREVAATMASAITDHVFIDEGHTLDFTNKAFEALEHLGWEQAGAVLPSLVAQTAGAARHEEESAWRHPDNLVELLDNAYRGLPSLLEAGEAGTGFDDQAVDDLAWQLLDEDPLEVVAAIDGALSRGARGEQVGRAVAYAAALRIVRFHTQNDHGDWDEVHHAFTAANALHQSLIRSTTPELLKGVYQCALRVFLDRFLNVPAARLPEATGNVDLGELQDCWDVEGQVERAGRVVYGFLSSGGSAANVTAALGRALLHEDAQFHWFQIFEAAVRQSQSWPEGSEPHKLILVGAARFLAAHTPTRRELAQVVRIATRLRRGEALYEDSEA